MSFDAIKTALCGEAVLCAPNFALPFSVQADASDRGLGAVLTQQVGGTDRPVLYLSRKLSDREGRYSTVEKECLAIRWAVGALRYYLLGRQFTLYSDHAPLQWLHRMKDANARITSRCSPSTSGWPTGRGRRWSWRISSPVPGGGGRLTAGWVPGLCRAVGVCGGGRRLACRGSMEHRVGWGTLPDWV